MNRVFVTSETRRRMRTGPLGAYLDGFAERLREQGYTPSSVRQKTRLTADLSDWLQRRKLSVKHLDERRVTAFLQHRHRVLRGYCGEGVALQMLLEQLRDTGVIRGRGPVADEGTVYPVESAFTQYLLQERGLSRVTVNGYVLYVRRFILERFGRGPLRLEALAPSDINKRLLRHSKTSSPSQCQAIAKALRVFLRFLHLRGTITVDLAAAVPCVRHWRLSTVPKFLKSEQVASLLANCHQDTVLGQRDYTVLLLLARLGLRAGEVVDMRLEDIDWEAGELTVRGKRGQQDRLPIPTDVGKALATYLRQGRPACSARHVFVRMKAPHRGFKESGAITYMVLKALRRAGLDPAHKGARILRHSLATQMLRRGASLTEVGEVLRHRCLDTTAIYAKVDVAALRALAQPWPGGEA
ncbi:MAG: integrase [Planctomycetes bacterium]|nr:integrase [Planctomycetota bacterium]